jgi:predicted GNAT superfamily acetyltransferase
LTRATLPACADLAEQRLQLEQPDQIPPWFMHTTGCYGGIALGAFADEQLVGYSYAVPAFDGAKPFLLSCGLAVTHAYGSRGIGEALKRAQAKRARHVGYDLIRWTTNSLASGPLHLYLSKLGGRLVGFREEMYAGLREGLFSDEVEIEWHICRTARSAKAAQRDSRSVEIPWDREALAARSPDLARRCVARVRAEMRELLAAGYVGTAVHPDRMRQRSLVRFDRP